MIQAARGIQTRPEAETDVMHIHVAVQPGHGFQGTQPGALADGHDAYLVLRFAEARTVENPSTSSKTREAR